MKTTCADGTISAYGFACGRTMDTVVSEYRSVHLWAQHGVYFLRDIDVLRGRQDTATYRTLYEAKRYYRAWVRIAKFTA